MQGHLPWMMLLPLDLLGWCCCLCIDLRLMLLPFLWLMLLPGGWCYCHMQCWLMLLPRWLILNPPMGVWQMLWPLGQCFNFNADVVFKTSSHMWDRWYLPMFLFRDGSFKSVHSKPTVSKEIAGHSNTVTPNGVGNAWG